MANPVVTAEQERALVADLVARLQSRANSREALQPEPGQQLPSSWRLVGWLAEQGLRISEPRNYPEGVKIEVTDSQGSKAFQGRTLRHSLLMAMEWRLDASKGSRE